MTYCGILNTATYLRTVFCLNDSKQRYFSRPNIVHSFFRRYLVDAPLFRTRHHREFKLSSAINIGTLPSRAQSLFLLTYLGTGAFLTIWRIDWSQKKNGIYTALIDRTGLLAIMNMAPLFLFAGRNNPLIKLTGITFDTYNLVHRWLGRLVVLESLLHTLFYLLRKIPRDGKHNVFKCHKSSFANQWIQVGPASRNLLQQAIISPLASLAPSLSQQSFSYH